MLLCIGNVMCFRSVVVCIDSFVNRLISCERSVIKVSLSCHACNVWP